MWPPEAGPHPEGAGAGEIIVSAGGGDVGGPVYEAAIAAAALVPCPIRILVGGAAAEERIADLQSLAPETVAVEAARKDFREMLYRAAASVSLCGYNTALDILQAGTPAVFVPFDEGNEVEQGIRARALSQHAGITTLSRIDLTPQTLSSALNAVINAPKRPTAVAQFNGASKTVEITHNLRKAL